MSQTEGSLRLVTKSVSGTRAVAGEVAALCRVGDLIVLIGGLGAGKTAFAQGLARGLGIDDRVTSPTFALVQSYDGDIRMHHLDVYRLTHVSETEDLALGELLDDDAVTLIEWGDTILSALPREYLEVTLVPFDDDSIDETSTGDSGRTEDEVGGVGSVEAGTGEHDLREVQIVARGPAWRPRMAALRGRLEEVLNEGDAQPC